MPGEPKVEKVIVEIDVRTLRVVMDAATDDSLVREALRLLMTEIAAHGLVPCGIHGGVAVYGAQVVGHWTVHMEGGDG